jgi:hypothetical protein
MARNILELNGETERHGRVHGKTVLVRVCLWRKSR